MLFHYLSLHLVIFDAFKESLTGKMLDFYEVHGPASGVRGFKLLG